MKLDRRNFSRKILSTKLLIDTGEKDNNSTTKKANLFRLDKARYQQKFYSFWHFMPTPLYRILIDNHRFLFKIP
jgi:8-oxo-dGTP diphosphatase